MNDNAILETLFHLRGEKIYKHAETINFLFYYNLNLFPTTLMY